MKNKIFTIIIPIYNVEPYIPRCLDSIYNQQIDDSLFEIIAVNDGSPDNSSDVVRKYQDIHSNIIIVEKENGGVSSARNVAIDKSCGKYLLFVDPDDALIEGCLFRIIDQVKEDNASDIIICKSFKGKKELYRWTDIFDNKIYYSANQILSGGYLRGSVCGVLFYNDFIERNAIKFVEGMRNGEDTNFMMQALFYTKAVAFADVEMYNVIGRGGSASRSYDKKRIDVMIQAAKYVSAMTYDLKKKSGNRIVLPYMVYSPISNLVSDALCTENIGYRYLANNGISGKLMTTDLKEISFLKWKMMLLMRSFFLFYYLKIVRHKCNVLRTYRN